MSLTYRSRWLKRIYYKVKNCESCKLFPFRVLSLRAIVSEEVLAKAVIINVWQLTCMWIDMIILHVVPCKEYDIRPPQFERIGINFKRENLSCSCMMIRFDSSNIKSFSDMRVSSNGNSAIDVSAFDFERTGKSFFHWWWVREFE